MTLLKRTSALIIAAAFAAAALYIPAFAAENQARAETTISASDKDGHRETETELGNLFADAVKSCAGADAAFIPCGDFSGRNISAGIVDEEAVSACISDDEDTVVFETDADHIYEILACSVSRFVLGEDEKIDWEASAFDGYLYTSGLKITFDYSALPGDPVYELKTSEGEKIERGNGKTYKIAAARSVAEGKYKSTAVKDYSQSGTLVSDLLEYLSDKEKAENPGTGRIKIIGTKDFTIAAQYPVLFILIVAVLFGGGGYLRQRLLRKDKR